MIGACKRLATCEFSRKVRISYRMDRKISPGAISYGWLSALALGCRSERKARQHLAIAVERAGYLSREGRSVARDLHLESATRKVPGLSPFQRSGSVSLDTPGVVLLKRKCIESQAFRRLRCLARQGGRDWLSLLRWPVAAAARKDSAGWESQCSQAMAQEISKRLGLALHSPGPAAPAHGLSSESNSMQTRCKRIPIC